MANVDKNKIKDKKDFKGGQKSYGKRNYNRGRGRNADAESVHDSDRGVNYNDPSWYKLNDQLAHDVASFSFGTPTGGPITLTSNGYQIPWTNSIPGTYSIYTIPAIGKALSETDPINIAMNSIFRNLRKGNTGSQVYDQPDVMMYVMAMDSLFSWFATLVRLYGLGRVYSYVNRYYADGITLAQGFDPSVLNNLAWLRGYINQLAVKINQFAVPDSLNIFKRHYWMYSNVFQDGETPKSQVYMYVPQALYMYDELNGAGMCRLIDVCGTTGTSGCLPRTALTDQNIINITNNLLDPLIKSQDVNIISGDIVKYWGESLYQLTGISDDYTVTPAYSEEVLSQIHNTTFMGNGLLENEGISSAYGYGTATIKQEVGINMGYLRCKPCFRGTNAANFDKIVDFRKIASPTPDDVLVATRNTTMSTATWDASLGWYMYSPYAFGSDLCLYHVTGRYSPTSNAFMFTVEPEQGVPTATALLSWFERMSFFDQAPLYYRFSSEGDHPLISVYGNIENYRVFTREDLETIHQGAILAMYDLKDTLK